MAAEILAPAGGYDALVAAVRCGANAVYLGGKALNARRNASNFSDEELREAVAYCHARNVKVYLTLNTLVADSELETAYDAIECACNSHADALILQDIGLVSLVRQVCPDMPMHASTQMSVQSIEGVRELEKMGFARVVLPRELSESEIVAIAAKTDMELEYFVHGALCMCVSGQCLMSSVLGGRSGNRGLCAQPCRLPFGVNSKGGNVLSLKDLSLVDELRRLDGVGRQTEGVGNVVGRAGGNEAYLGPFLKSHQPVERLAECAVAAPANHRVIFAAEFTGKPRCVARARGVHNGDIVPVAVKDVRDLEQIVAVSLFARAGVDYHQHLLFHSLACFHR